MPELKPGQLVRLAFRLSLADGTLIDSAAHTAPLAWVFGDGALAPCLEALLIDVAPGTPQQWLLAPEQAFGWPEPECTLDLPRDTFSALEPLAVGQVVSFETPDGQRAAGRVLALETARVRLDFNHPLAGHVLVFEFELLEVPYED